MEAENIFNPAIKLAMSDRLGAFVSGKTISPVNVEISPCQVCNAHCEHCFYKNTHLKMSPESIMDATLLMRLLRDMELMGVRVVSWTGGGEPTLHPNFPMFAKTARNVGLRQGLFTNGLLPPKYDPALFDWIRVSNTDRDWNVAAMKEIRARVPKLGMAFNYTGDDSQNSGDKALRRAIEVGHEVGVRYVQVRQALNLRGHVTKRQPPEIKDPLLHITQYKFDDSGNPHGYTNCYGYHFVPFIWHDGDVDVCAYHRKKGPYTLGNLNGCSFKEIMESAPPYVPVIETCQVCCKNHECNKAVNAALRAQDPDFL